MVHIVPVHEILQDGTAFPDFELLTVLVRVDDGRDAAIGVDIEVPLLFLLMFKELDWTYLHAELCQGLLFLFVSKGGSGAVMGSYVILQA